MLSYRHTFHAGNHADVLKHIVLVQLLRHLRLKEKPFQCVDTHAGPAVHSLDSAFARKKSEFASGIARLWDRTDTPLVVTDYLDQVRSHNPGGALKIYPGSPQISMQLLRRQDRLRLFELHSTESRLLEAYFEGAGARVTVQAGDGFEGLKSVLPPPSRRGLVLIDPSYEDKNDYRNVQTALKEGLRRFATGTYAIWYPQVQRRESGLLPLALQRIPDIDWLHVSLTVKAQQEDGFGLHGSGLFVVNPPFTLPKSLAVVMPYLVRVLGQDQQANFALEHHLS